jgi:hypothetical protein
MKLHTIYHQKSMPAGYMAVMDSLQKLEKKLNQ